MNNPKPTDPGPARSFPLGQRVIYNPGHPGAKDEEGVVTGSSNRLTFVCFGLEGTTSRACRSEDLRAVHR